MGCCVSNEDRSAYGSQDGHTARDDGSNEHTHSRFSSRRKHGRYTADGSAADDDSQDGDSQAYMTPRELLAMLREEFPPVGDPSGVDIVVPDENDLTELQQSLRQHQLNLQQQNSLTSSLLGPAAKPSYESVHAFVVHGGGGEREEGGATTPAGEESLVAHTPGEGPLCNTTTTPERPPPLFNDATGTPQSTPGALQHCSPTTASMGTPANPPAAAAAAAAASPAGLPDGPRARHLKLRQRVSRWMAHHVHPPTRPINVDTGPFFDNDGGTADGGSSSGFESHGHPCNTSFSSPHSEAETLPHTMPAASSEGGEIAADPDGIDDLPLGATATELVVPLHGPMFFVNPGLGGGVSAASVPAPGHQGTPISTLMGSGTRLNRRTSAGGTITFVGGDGSLSSSLRGSAAPSPMGGTATLASGSGAPAAFPSPALLRVSSMGRRRGASFNTQVSSSDGMPTSRYPQSSSMGEASATNTQPAVVGPLTTSALPLLQTGSSGEFAPQEQAPAVAVTAVEDTPNDVAPFQGFSPKHAGGPPSGLTASPPTNQQALSPAVGLTLPGFSRRSSRLSEQNVADVPENDDMLDYFAPTPLAANSNTNHSAAAGGLGSSLNRPRSAVGLAASLGSHPGTSQTSPPRRAVSPFCAAGSPGTSTMSQPLAASPAAAASTPPNGSVPQLVRSTSVDHPHAVPEVDELIPGFVWSMQADERAPPNDSTSAIATAAETALPEQELQTRPGTAEGADEQDEEEEEDG